MNSPAAADPARDPRVRLFRAVYLILALQFAIPAVSYLVAPQLAEDSLDQLNRLLGGGAWPRSGLQAQPWQMLSVSNVLTLAFLCWLLQHDLRRFFPALPGLLFLKGCSALVSVWLGFRLGLPGFFGIFALDGGTTLLMWILAVRAKDALDGRPPRPWWTALLVFPGRIAGSLDRAARAGVVPRLPGPWQLCLGEARMVHRLVFRSATIGTCATRPVRPTARARLFRWRALRLPALLWERAVAPLDFTGLASAPARIVRHLLGAHHDGEQALYDLELLALHPGWLHQLRDELRALERDTGPRGRWLRDLTVFEGYHAELLALVERVLAQPSLLEQHSADADLSLRGFLRWCAAQPATPAETWRALRAGGLRFAPARAAAHDQR